MLKKTHLAVGTAASLCVLQPTTMKELLIGTSVAMLGSVISDMDSEASKTNRYMDVIVTITALVVVGVTAFSMSGRKEIWNWLRSDLVMTPKVITGIAFFIICAFGKEQPHRSFMHSLLGLFALYGCVEVIFPGSAPYFGVAFLSHILLDLLNRKGIRLFYPLQKRICLDVCSSSGWINDILLKLGLWVSVIALVYRVLCLLF